jgi:acetyl esterase/lipase
VAGTFVLEPPAERLTRETIAVTLLAALLTAAIAYGPGANEQLHVFTAEQPGSCAVALVHGGWWHAHINAIEAESQALWLQKEGCAVFDINYPEDSGTQPAFPAQPDAVVNAVRWIQQYGGEYNADPARIVVLGGSTGGNIGLLGAEEVDAATPGVVKGIASLSGPTNLLSLAEVLRKAHAEGRGSGYGSLAQALGCKRLPASCNAAAERWSPINQIPGACPPVYLAGGVRDIVPDSQQQEMAVALQAAGCDVTLRTVQPGGHSFAYWTNSNGRTLPQVRAEVLAFIRRF